MSRLTPQRIIPAAKVLLGTLVIVALSGCVRHDFQQSFAPQTVTIDFPVTLTNVTITAAASTPATVTADCETLMAAYNLAAGQADPYERAPEDTQMGDGCATVAGEPVRQ